MRMLIIDTSTRRNTVASFRGAELLGVHQSEQPMMAAENLLGTVSSVLGQTGWEAADLELVGVGVGPGSFTGVRVGMATAKGLALSLRVPLVGVVSLDAMAAAAGGHAPTKGAGVIAMLDARKGEVFVACYAPEGRRTTDPEHLPRNVVHQWVGGKMAGLGQGAVLVGEVVSELGLGSFYSVRSHDCDLPGPRALARLALERWRRTGRDELDTLEPLYVRAPDITLRV